MVDFIISKMRSKKLRIVAVLPAYNAAGSLQRFLADFPFKIFDEVILVDDDSEDATFKIAKRYVGSPTSPLGLRGIKIKIFRNSRNLGYGGNMKRCLDLALKSKADIVVEIHPDGEYGFDGILPGIREMKRGADLVLGNRFYSRFSALRSGMYVWKIPVTKGLTWIGNLVLGTKIPDLHQGFRLYSKDLLKRVDYQNFSNDFLFTFELIVEVVKNGLKIRNVPVTTFYSGRKRGVDLSTSINYSLRTIQILLYFKTKRLKFSVE